MSQQVVIVSVFDKAINAHVSINTVPTTAAAVRSFIDEVNRDEKTNNLFNHSADFDLYELSRIDVETGISTSDLPILLIRGADAKSKV